MVETIAAKKISVCMATYNGEKYLAEQLRSILKQIGQYDELVISDDHSTDNTVDVIQSFTDKRIKLIYNNTERGYTRNFENAIKYATGNMIFISDQDDVWQGNKVETMKRYLENYDLVISDATYVNESLEVTAGSHFALNNMKRGFFRQLVRPCYIGACMAFNRVVLEKALPFPEHAKYCAYDYWLTLIGESCYKVRLVDAGLILYRRHSGNTSPAGKKSSNSLTTRVLIRMYSFAVLVKRILATSMLSHLKRMKKYSMYNWFYVAICVLLTKLFYPGARLVRFPLDLRNAKNVRLGKRFTCGRGCRIEACNYELAKGVLSLTIGDNVELNDFVHISAFSRVVIGDNVLIASKVYISDVNHGNVGDGDVYDISIPHRLQRLHAKPIAIEENVWIGESVCILGGVTIGKGSIIGAMSVVTKSIPPQSIAVGNPAKVIKQYNHESKSWERVRK